MSALAADDRLFRVTKFAAMKARLHFNIPW